MTTLIIVVMGVVNSLTAKSVSFSGKHIDNKIQNHLIMTAPVGLSTNDASATSVAVDYDFRSGTTWSYTEHISAGEEAFDVKTYFVFISPTDVIWLFGTPKGDMFPVGFGMFNPSTGNIVFSANDRLHKKISIYYNQNTVIFNFDPSTGNTRLISKDDNHYLERFYNGGRNFYMSKEDYTLTPKEDLVGTFWECEDEGETYVVYFKSWKEVVLIGLGETEEACAYVYIDDMVSIKSGDNISDENMVGRYRGGNEMPLCREGIDPHGDVFCVTLRKVK